jgi:hypothetical protein
MATPNRTAQRILANASRAVYSGDAGSTTAGDHDGPVGMVKRAVWDISHWDDGSVAGGRGQAKWDISHWDGPDMAGP